MHHFVQYHNPDLMGRYRSSPKNYSIVSNKFFTSLVGETAWLVTSKGRRPRRYFLCSSFVVDEVERDNAGRFRNRAIGSKGQDFENRPCNFSGNYHGRQRRSIKTRVRDELLWLTPQSLSVPNFDSGRPAFALSASHRRRDSSPVALCLIEIRDMGRGAVACERWKASFRASSGRARVERRSQAED